MMTTKCSGPRAPFSLAASKIRSKTRPAHVGCRSNVAVNPCTVSCASVLRAQANNFRKAGSQRQASCKATPSFKEDHTRRSKMLQGDEAPTAKGSGGSTYPASGCRSARPGRADIAASAVSLSSYDELSHPGVMDVLLEGLDNQHANDQAQHRRQRQALNRKPRLAEAVHAVAQQATQGLRRFLPARLHGAVSKGAQAVAAAAGCAATWAGHQLKHASVSLKQASKPIATKATRSTALSKPASAETRLSQAAASASTSRSMERQHQCASLMLEEAVDRFKAHVDEYRSLIDSRGGPNVSIPGADEASAASAAGATPQSTPAAATPEDYTYVNVAAFNEDAENLLGRGGCGKVYRWHVREHEVVVKADIIKLDSSKHSPDYLYERCGDVLPALLPEHPNIMVPRAWWVAAIPGGATTVKDPAPPALSTAGAAAAAKLVPKRRFSFKLMTLFDRKACDLGAYITARHANASAQGAAATSGILDERSMLVVVRDVASALAMLQAHGVLHCDVKPENVLLDLSVDNQAHTCALQSSVSRATLCDFGLARLFAPNVESLEARGGTWLYKAPEQLKSPSNPSPRVYRTTDMWALGALICCMVRGSLAAHNGEPASSVGPWGTRASLANAATEEEVAKFGMRPDEQGNPTPFFQLYSDMLPPNPSGSGRDEEQAASRSRDASGSMGCCSDATMSLLHGIARACMAKDPRKRPSAECVAALAAGALEHLDTRAQLLMSQDTT